MLHCLVFTSQNEVMRRAYQLVIADENNPSMPEGRGTPTWSHECMAWAKGSAVPDLVLKIEFVDDYEFGDSKVLRDLIKVTAVRVNGKMKMKDAVSYSANDDVFGITEEGIEYIGDKKASSK